MIDLGIAMIPKTLLPLELNFAVLTKSLDRQAILRRIHLEMKGPLMPTDNVQISDVLNSHLINYGFLSAQKPILHAAEYNNSQGVVGGQT